MICSINLQNNFDSENQKRKNFRVYYKNHFDYISQNIKSNNNYNRSNLSFCGNYNEFIGTYTKCYGNLAKMPEVLTSFLKNTSLLIGKGSKKIVYSIPKLPKYVIAHIQDTPINSSAPFYKSKDTYLIGDKYNFGQPIAENGYNTIIMERVQGKSHSVENWPIICRKYILEDIPPTPKEATDFLNSLRLIANMPIKAYEHVINEIKFLSEKGIVFDFENPNNILVDEINNKISYIDIPEGLQKYISDTLNQKPTVVVTDLIAALCDSMLNLQYCKVLGGKEAKEIQKLTRTVINKSKIAADNIGLNNDNSVTHNNMIIREEYFKHRRGLSLKHTYKNIYSDFSHSYNL